MHARMQPRNACAAADGSGGLAGKGNYLSRDHKDEAAGVKPKKTLNPKP